MREHVELSWLSMRLDNCFFSIMIFNTTFLVFVFKQVILSSVMLHAMSSA